MANPGSTNIRWQFYLKVLFHWNDYSRGFCHQKYFSMNNSVESIDLEMMYGYDYGPKLIIDAKYLMRPAVLALKDTRNQKNV